jgi:hypothetical protein
MGLPGVNIKIQNGSLGSVPTSKDGIAGLILTGATVSGANNVTIGSVYQIFSLADAEAIGIMSSGTNAYAHSHIKDFYDTAGNGSELWFMLAASTITMEDMLDKTKLFAPKLLDAANGSIRKLAVSRKSAAGITITNGLDADVDKALIKGQVLADEYVNNFKPFRFIVDGKDFNGTVGDLKDYRTASFNRGSVLIGAISSSKNASVGFILGTMAKLPVQRKISRVKNGALPISDAYFTNQTTTESLENAWGSIHDKGYIFFRTFVGKSGYFFNSDSTATSLSDDYSSLSRGFVIDKATTIAYLTFVEEIEDEAEVNDAGQIDGAIVKALQAKIESNIELQMIRKDEASGVDAFIDPNQDVLATDTLDMSLKVRPKGYKKYINIELGFTNPTNN